MKAVAVPEEIEAKVRIADPDGFRRRMAELGPASRGPEAESNWLFDDAAGTLRRAGSAVRLRIAEAPAPEGGTATRAALTYKGPRRKGPLKRRDEIETAVDAPEATRAILRQLGLAETFYYEKRRTVWHVGACEVTLDEVPHLGWFAEVEGPTEEAVREGLEAVGLAHEPTISVGYVHLLIDRLEALGLDPSHAAF